MGAGPGGGSQCEVNFNNRNSTNNKLNSRLKLTKNDELLKMF